MEVGNLIARILEALVWPITVVIIIFLFRKQISNIILNLSKLRYKDFEAEFGRDLQVAESKAEQLELPSPETLRQDIEPITLASSYDRLFELATLSPRAAVTEAWLRVEAAIDEVARALEFKPSPLRRGREAAVLLELIGRDKLPKDTMLLYDDLRKMRNNAAHAIEFEISIKDATRYVDLALGLAHRVRTALSE